MFKFRYYISRYFLFFSLDLIEEYNDKDFDSLNMDKIKSLVADKRDAYGVKHPAAKSILAEFKDEPKKKLEFKS